MFSFFDFALVFPLLKKNTQNSLVDDDNPKLSSYLIVLRAKTKILKFWKLLSSLAIREWA